VGSSEPRQQKFTYSNGAFIRKSSPCRTGKDMESLSERITQLEISRCLVVHPESKAFSNIVTNCRSDSRNINSSFHVRIGYFCHYFGILQFIDITSPHLQTKN
jgi:hypothetical protein